MQMAILSNNIFCSYKLSALCIKIYKKLVMIHAFYSTQGMLPLTFADKADYDKIQPDDLITLNDLINLAPGRVSGG